LYAPATKATNYFALVADDPNIVYEIQEGGGTTYLTKTATSKNAQYVYAAPATPGTTQYSGTTLDNGTSSGNVPATTATWPLKILGLSQKYDNGAFNAYGQYAKWEVIINNHLYGHGTGQVGY
jgi:hypothetical protein